MSRKRVKLSDQLRRAIKKSGVTRYRIWKLTGIPQSTLSEFMHSRSGLSIESLDAIADILGIDLVIHKQD